MAVPDGYSALDGSERPRPDAHRLMGPVEAYYNFPNSGAADQTIGVIAPSDPPGGSGRRLSGYLSNDILNLYFPNLTNASYRTKPVLKDIGMTVGTNSYVNNTTSVSISNKFALEVTQDISTCATIAQGATVNVYFTEGTEQGLIVCPNRILQPEGENQPSVVTCSFSFWSDDASVGSPSSSGSIAATVSPLFQALAAQGKRPLRPGPVLQEPREVRPGPQLRDRQLDRPGPGVPPRDAWRGGSPPGLHAGYIPLPPPLATTGTWPGMQDQATQATCTAGDRINSHTASVSSPSVPAVRITWLMSAGLAPSQAPVYPETMRASSAKRPGGTVMGGP